MRESQKIAGRAVAIFCMAMVSACSYDVEDELFPSNLCNDVNVSYAEDIVPILETRCYQCHDSAAQFGGVIVDDYQKLTPHLESGRLLGAVQHQTGFSPMPQDQPKIPECEIRKIASWVNAGFPNN